jgi:dihydropteroate synthase
MRRYYTRVCNFYYGEESKLLISKQQSIPLNNNKEISFDHVEIISRKSKKKVSLKNIHKLPKLVKKQIFIDLKNIKTNKKNFANLNFKI